MDAHLNFLTRHYFDFYIQRFFVCKVFVPPLSTREDMKGVVHEAFMFDKAVDRKSVCGQDLAEMAGRMIDFVWWFKHKVSSLRPL